MIWRSMLRNRVRAVPPWHFCRVGCTLVVHVRILGLLLFDQEILQYKAVHLALGKRVKSVSRRVHNRFAFEIEGSVE